uniref:DUF281 domain-containing protein n=1 Tax=Steinernema glaseri TaxID=37863 RepID=A0A1I7ZTK0_9BILA
MVPVYLFVSLCLYAVPLWAGTKCYECIYGDILTKSGDELIYPEQPTDSTIDCFNPSDPLTLHNAPCDTFCVELAYGSGEKKSSWIIRGCYTTLMNTYADNGNFTLKKFGKNEKYIHGEKYAMRACDPAEGETTFCNGKLLMNNGVLKETTDPTPSPSEAKKCMQCKAEDELCQYPQVESCDKKYCMNELGIRRGVNYEKYACTDVNPYLASGTVAVVVDVVNPLFGDKTNITRKYCETDHCNYVRNSAAALGLVMPLLVIILSLSFF